MNTPDTTAPNLPDTQAPPPQNTNDAPPPNLNGVEGGPPAHVNLRKGDDGKVYLMSPWPSMTTLLAAMIDGGTINRTGDVINFHPDNGIAAYAIKDGDADPLLLELQPGSIYDEKVPQPALPADAPRCTDCGLQLAGGHAANCPEAVTEGVTGAVTASVTALENAGPPPIPEDLHLEALPNRALSDLMDDHGIDGGSIENRAHAIRVLGEKRDSILPTGPVEVLIEGEPEIVAQDGTTPGSVWNAAHQQWVMPAAA